VFTFYIEGHEVYSKARAEALVGDDVQAVIHKSGGQMVG
jgi:hypothetical protein